MSELAIEPSNRLRMRETKGFSKHGMEVWLKARKAYRKTTGAILRLAYEETTWSQKALSCEPRLSKWDRQAPDAEDSNALRVRQLSALKRGDCGNIGGARGGENRPEWTAEHFTSLVIVDELLWKEFSLNRHGRSCAI